MFSVPPMICTVYIMCDYHSRSTVNNNDDDSEMIHTIIPLMTKKETGPGGDLLFHTHTLTNLDRKNPDSCTCGWCKTLTVIPLLIWTLSLRTVELIT